MLSLLMPAVNCRLLIFSVLPASNFLVLSSSCFSPCFLQFLTQLWMLQTSPWLKCFSFLYLAQLLIPEPSCRYSEIAALSAHPAYLLKCQEVSNKRVLQCAGKCPQRMTAPVSKMFFENTSVIQEKKQAINQMSQNEIEGQITQTVKTHIPYVLLQQLFLVTRIVFYSQQQN